MAQYRLLGVSGSLRAGSTNTKLVRAAAAAFDPAQFTLANLRMPLYDGDLEEAEGIPPEAQALSDQIAAADAVILSTPEYNKVMPGVLKNALDWVSRTGPVWKDKPVAVMSAAAGRAGGERAQWTLRLALLPFRPVILPGPEVMLASSSKAFDADGTLTDAFAAKLVHELMADLKAKLP